MRRVEDAIEEAESVDARLAAYDEMICHIRQAMEEMETKNKRITVATENNKTLLHELDNMIVSILIILSPKGVLDA